MTMDGLIRTSSRPVASRAEREQQLRSSVEQLYRVFRSYALAAYIEPDPCFPNCCDDRPLRAAPLHLLPPEAFRMYQGKAITTWGSVDDFKQFLPRLLELLAWRVQGSDLMYIDSFLVFSKLQYAHWRTWPARECTAIADFIESFWIYSIGEPRHPLEFYDIKRQLEDMAAAFTYLSPFLDHWNQAMRQPDCGLIAALHLADFIDDSSTRMSKSNRLGWPADWEAQEDQILAWLLAEEVRQLLEDAFFRAADPTEAERLSRANHILLLWARRSA
jgi:hypothetical protein